VLSFQSVNFINILSARFLYKSELSSFSLITFGFEIFWRQNIGKNITHKMLTKSTPYGVDFPNVVRAAFALPDPKSAKDTDDLTVFLCFWDLCV